MNKQEIFNLLLDARNIASDDALSLEKMAEIVELLDKAMTVINQLGETK